MFRREKEDPSACLWKTWPNPNRLSKGRTKVDFPELVGPTIMGVRVVLEGPASKMFLRATASSDRDNVERLASKKVAAA